MTTEFNHLEITDEEVEQVKSSVKQTLEQQIHASFIAQGYRPVNENEFSAECEFQDYVKYRKAGRTPTRIVSGSYTPSRDEDLTNYSLKS
jgi:hypothetical protein